MTESFLPILSAIIVEEEGDRIFTHKQIQNFAKTLLVIFRCDLFKVEDTEKNLLVCYLEALSRANVSFDNRKFICLQLIEILNLTKPQEIEGTPPTKLLLGKAEETNSEEEIEISLDDESEKIITLSDFESDDLPPDEGLPNYKAMTNIIREL